MGLATSALTSTVAVGNREDLSDQIYRIDPTETPFFSGIEKVKSSNILHEWQTQALAAASTSNAQLEGDDSYNADAATVTVRLGNQHQISRKTPRVTGTQQAVDPAGRENEFDYQQMLKGLELRRDIEAILTGANQAKVTRNSSTAGKVADVLSWIKTATDKGASGVDPTAADGTSLRTDGTQRAFAESQLKGVLKTIYTNGGKPDTIMLGAFNKQAFSMFMGRATPTQDATKKNITAAVEVYVSDFGTLKAVPNLFMRVRDCLVLQMDKWAYVSLPGRNFLSYMLAKTGDTDAKTVLCEYSLEARQEKASGGVFDLTSS